MRRHLAAVFFAVTLLAALPSAQAQAGFGFLPGAEGFAVAIQDEGGVGVKTQAGSHPYAISTSVDVQEGDLRNLDLELPAGLIENPSAVNKCSQERFHEARSSPFEATRSGESCPAVSQIGTIEIRSDAVGNPVRSFGLFNLEPPPGFPAQIGASPFGTPMVFTHLNEAEPTFPWAKCPISPLQPDHIPLPT